MKITIIQNGIKTQKNVAAGTLLIEALGGRVEASCGGKGRCGKCKVIVDGQTVLACLTPVDRDMEVILPDDYRAKILTEGITRDVTPDGEPGLGVAVDVGTTTIAARLIRLEDGAVLKTVSQLNRQKQFGSDVISRIEKGTPPLHECIIKQLNDIISELKGKNEIKRLVFAGNTAMMHFVQGFSVDTLAVAPYKPYNIEMITYDAADLGLDGNFEAIAAPCIAGYVGADTVCAILACQMDMGQETSLLVDIGTNGEIVLKHEENLLCCSAAAGPAFEGAHIKHGTGSIEGAINKVVIKNGIHTETIGGKEPIGICGSGIIDATAEMLKNDIIDESGFLEHDFKIAPGIYITQSDIREIQLAKSAIRAGIETLLSENGTASADIKYAYLAGGLGNCADVENAAYIGLMPAELKDKAIASGNAALGGLSGLLVSRRLRDKAKEIAHSVKHVDLAANAFFQNSFISNISF